MGKPATLLEGLCGHALALGAQSILVEYKDRRQWVFAMKGTVCIGIANYSSSGRDGQELQGNLVAAAKKPRRAVLTSEVYILRVRVFESFGEDAYEVSIEPAPKPDGSVTPSFTPKQGQYLAFIHHYTKIHRKPPSEADLQQYFGVSAPSVHTMIQTLQRNCLIEKSPGQPRSIRLLVPPDHLPPLN